MRRELGPTTATHSPGERTSQSAISEANPGTCLDRSTSPRSKRAAPSGVRAMRSPVRRTSSRKAGSSATLPSGPPVRWMLPLQTIRRTFADRMLVVGDAGGFTKPTTGGGIFYSLLSASLAADVLVEGFQAGRLDTAFLSAYERRWESRLGPELKVAAWLRQVLARATDAEIRLLLEAAAADDVRALIGHTARFNWHGDLIRSAVRHPRIAVLLLRLLLR